jgi:p-aminobenzoyl-glutamate transporter AbgT
MTPRSERITLIVTLAVLAGALVIQLLRHSSVWFVTAAVLVVVVVVRIVAPALQQRQGRDK